MSCEFSGLVKFLPWIGKQYDGGFLPRRKLLVLGESHYSSNGTREFTRRVVREYIAGAGYRFFTSIHQAVAGIHHTDPMFDHDKFWHSVAFYNFVQEAVGDGPRQRPTGEMIVNSTPAFKEVIGNIMPTHILVLGKFLWANIPDFDSIASFKLKRGDEDVECGYYVENGHKMLAMGILHPASGFSSEAWHPTISEFLSRE